MASKNNVKTSRENTRPFDPEQKQILAKIANTIRELAMDATQKADSGHPGLPMGCAEIGAYLFGHFLKHNPKDSQWFNRDRFILSAGHGSLLLYSCLHLSGFKLSMEDIKNFRQLHSKTPGHPEEGHTDGVETTTGPLGQGIGNSVGQALGFKMLAARFNTPKHKIIDNKIVTLISDGCVMEGVASEVSSLAGHWKLDNLIAIYDSNHITLDGPLSDAFSENTRKRYEAYGWDVHDVDGHNIDDLHEVMSKVQANQQRPVLIIATTIIGKGAPSKAGTSKAHGSPLGEEEVRDAKAALNLPEEPFYVPQAVYDYFDRRIQDDIRQEEAWKEIFHAWAKENPELYKQFQAMHEHKLPSDLEKQLTSIDIKGPIASRKSSSMVIQTLSSLLPQLIGGSADLSSSDLTTISKDSIITSSDFLGRNIKFGVREFGMATIATGLAQTGMFTPFIGTFLTFSDYMRNAIRLCSLMKEQVIYQFTHDSIFLGEDGPTHQPIEHYAALRAMINLHVIRPADANEVKMAWLAALKYDGPTALVLSRQNLPDLQGTKVPYAEGMGRGAYIIKKEKKKPKFMLVATGSEVSLALDVAAALEKMGHDVRVISMPCWELYEEQPKEYKDSVFGGDLGQRVSIEAGVEMGWHKYIGIDGIAICIDRYGASAPYKDLAVEYGFTVESILERIL